jgi:hypothetical protein
MVHPAGIPTLWIKNESVTGYSLMESIFSTSTIRPQPLSVLVKEITLNPSIGGKAGGPNTNP